MSYYTKNKSHVNIIEYFRSQCLESQAKDLHWD